MMARICRLCTVDLDIAPCFCIAKGMTPAVDTPADVGLAVVPLVPGSRPPGVCCEVCRLTPDSGFTNGERFICQRCYQ